MVCRTFTASFSKVSPFKLSLKHGALPRKLEERMFEPFSQRRRLIEMLNRIAIHSNNLDDKSDFISFKILQIITKC